MEHVDMTNSGLWNFRQNFEFSILRPYFPSKGHIWPVWVIFLSKKTIYGPYGPFISWRKSIYGPSVHIFLMGSPYITVLWVSELILWVSELIPLYFGCLNLYSGSMDLYFGWMNLYFGCLNICFGCLNLYFGSLSIKMPLLIKYPLQWPAWSKVKRQNSCPC